MTKDQINKYYKIASLVSVASAIAVSILRHLRDK